MITLLIAAYVSGITNTATIDYGPPKQPMGQIVLFPKTNGTFLVLDTNVFTYDSNRNVITLVGGRSKGKFYPITDNQYEIVRPKIITKIHGLWYVKLNLVIGIIVGAALGSWFGIRSGFKKGTK